MIKAELYIAAITQHLPGKSFQLVRYYGWYTNRAQGDRQKREQEKPLADQTAVEAAEILDVIEPLAKEIHPDPGHEVHEYSVCGQVLTSGRQ